MQQNCLNFEEQDNMEFLVKYKVSQPIGDTTVIIIIKRTALTYLR